MTGRWRDSGNEAWRRERSIGFRPQTPNSKLAPSSKPNSAIQLSAAEPQKNVPRLWSETQPQRVGIAALLRLVLRTQPRSEKSSRAATISGDTDRTRGTVAPWVAG